VFDEAASRKLEAVYHTPDIVTQRRQTLNRLALREGASVIDIGSGPGILLAEMAEVVGPEGRATGVDVSDSMLALTAQRFSSSLVKDRVSFLKADATRLPFEPASFDAAISTQVYEYVPDIDLALAELYRVLRPGARAVILDTDWDSIVWNATDEALMGRVLSLWTRRFAHPHLPRTLSHRLRAAGFQVLGREVVVFFNPEYDPNTYSLTNAEIMADFVGPLGLSSHEVHAWTQDLRDLGTKGCYFFSLNRYLFLAVKPTLDPT
jgi:ubiquinone/menaquinone biosynthesis C-methylase UbiE